MIIPSLVISTMISLPGIAAASSAGFWLTKCINLTPPLTTLLPAFTPVVGAAGAFSSWIDGGVGWAGVSSDFGVR